MVRRIIFVWWILLLYLEIEPLTMPINRRSAIRDNTPFSMKTRGDFTTARTLSNRMLKSLLKSDRMEERYSIMEMELEDSESARHCEE